MIKKTLQIALIDDSPAALDYLSYLIKELPGYEVLFRCIEPADIKGMVKQFQPDILIMDIDLGTVSGLDLAKIYGTLSIPVILISGHDFKPSQIFDVHPVDYLEKPVSLERLLEALEIAKNVLLKQITAAQAPDKSFVYLKGASSDTIVIDPNDIQYVKGGPDHTTIYANKKCYLVNSSLTAMEDSLYPHRIIRIHRSYMVNMNQVIKITPIKVILQNQDCFPIGKTYQKNLHFVDQKKIS